MKLLVGALRGDAGKVEAELRLVSIWAPMRRCASHLLTLDISAGQWTLVTDGKETGKGTLARGKKINHPLAAGQDWPSFFGSLAAMRGPDYSKPLVDDLAKARPLWRSETVSLSGWGTGVDSRYKARAAYGTLCGGSSSPIVADGLIHLYHYRPSGDVVPEGADAELLQKFEGHAHEHEAMRRYFSKRADLVASCIDAATGRTVWESVWPMKQGNYQTHKWRSNNHTPAVAKGVLVVSDYSMGLHAFDAKTGELKWTRGGGGDVPKDGGAVGPIISGEVVIWATSRGTVRLGLFSGKDLWEGPAAGGGARRMIIAGQERVLLVGNPLVLVDPATGTEIARIAYPGGYDNKGRLEIGQGAGANLVCDGPYIVSFQTSRVNDKGVGQIFALKVSGTTIEPAGLTIAPARWRTVTLAS